VQSLSLYVGRLLVERFVSGTFRGHDLSRTACLNCVEHLLVEVSRWEFSLEEGFVAVGGRFRGWKVSWVLVEGLLGGRFCLLVKCFVDGRPRGRQWKVSWMEGFIFLRFHEWKVFVSGRFLSVEGLVGWTLKWDVCS